MKRPSGKVTGTVPEAPVTVIAIVPVAMRAAAATAAPPKPRAARGTRSKKSAARKPPHVLLARGVRLAREEPVVLAGWVAKGCRPVSRAACETRIQALMDGAV